MMAVLVGVVFLAVVGALTLVHLGVQQQMCWKYPGGTPADGPATWACNGVDWLHSFGGPRPTQ